MENKVFKPKIDKLFWIILVISSVIMLALTALSFVPQWNTLAFVITALSDIFIVYFLISPLFGYVEMRERTLFIKFGFILKREIPYEKIRKLKVGRGIYSESMLSLKNSLEHVNIYYNSYDVATVSVKSSDRFIEELKARI